MLSLPQSKQSKQSAYHCQHFSPISVINEANRTISTHLNGELITYLYGHTDEPENINIILLDAITHKEN